MAYLKDNDIIAMTVVGEVAKRPIHTAWANGNC